ncbi:hypothetical protein HMPREF9176_1694 [Streptococcus downei F0415]|uniref:Uncharacterized protein n=1 Tax=Streptococcus downei MFe28 TaxID=764290 RepID=A0A380JFM4_STRDO|nr:hypothetical protein HMPREF9176_1694 [Streptococcus downei F0415]SUN36546.1 Uncharacterised protein [Streptococcus downei MFe28]
MADIEALLKREKDLVFVAKPLEIAQLFLEDRILWTHVFYEDGLAINVLYELDNPKKRSVSNSRTAWKCQPSWKAALNSHDKNLN